MLKKKGSIKIENMKSNCCPNLIFSVSFSGFNEGSSSPLGSEKEVQAHIKYLVERHSQEYDLKIIDNRLKQQVLKC